jgi:hypothetical protein
MEILITIDLNFGTLLTIMTFVSAAINFVHSIKNNRPK